MAKPGRKETISDAEILREIRLAPDPIVTATEVGERIGMTRQGANNRLEDLVKEGYLNERQVGARAVVYWLTDEGRQKAAEG